MVSVKLAAFVVLASFVFQAAESLRADQPPAVNPPGSQPPATVPPETATPISGEIAQWIHELGSDSFETRETATQQLEKSGQAAIEPLTLAAGGDSLEVTARAVRILQAIYRAGNDKASEAAEVALEQLSAAPNRSAARRASLGLLTQDAIRQKRALAKIQEMGGTVSVIESIRGNNGEPHVNQVKLTKDWKGGDAGLVQLKRLSGLSSLYVIAGANVTPQGLEALQKSLPNLRIEHRGQAMLGVSCGTSEKGARIDLIAENSAAENAGLEVGDVITKFNGQEVKQFEHVIEITKKSKAGDKVIIEIQRNGETLRKEVTLGEWK